MYFFIDIIFIKSNIYSLPRFFELDTIQRRRPLCSTFTGSSIDNSSFPTTTTSTTNLDFLRLSNTTTFKEILTEPWNYNFNCNQSEIEEQLNMKYRKLNQTMHHSVLFQELMKHKCNFFKVSTDKISFDNIWDDTTTTRYGFQYPLINDYNSECECDKDLYQPSEITNCTCKATNEICNRYEVAPLLNVTEMRYNEYYISVSI